MRDRLTESAKTHMEAEAWRLIAHGLTAESAWAKIASYALAKQSEAAAKELAAK